MRGVGVWLRVLTVGFFSCASLGLLLTSAASAHTLAFTSPGCEEWEVPAGVGNIVVRAVGEAGRAARPSAREGSPSSALGGAGNGVEGPLAVTLGERLNVCVGVGGGTGGAINEEALQRGQSRQQTEEADPEGGEGGGYSAVATAGSPVLVAAGGGGGGGCECEFEVRGGEGGAAEASGGAATVLWVPGPIFGWYPGLGFLGGSAAALAGGTGGPGHPAADYSGEDVGGAGGGGGGGYRGGAGGTSQFAVALEPGSWASGGAGGGGGSDYCAEGIACVVEHGVGTGEEAGTSPEEAKVLIIPGPLCTTAVGRGIYGQRGQPGQLRLDENLSTNPGVSPLLRGDWDSGAVPFHLLRLEKARCAGEPGERNFEGEGIAVRGTEGGYGMSFSIYEHGEGEVFFRSKLTKGTEVIEDTAGPLQRSTEKIS